MSPTKPAAAATKHTLPEKSSPAHRVAFPFPAAPLGQAAVESGSHCPLPGCEEAVEQQSVFTFSAVAASPAGVTQASSYKNMDQALLTTKHLQAART